MLSTVLYGAGVALACLVFLIAFGLVGLRLYYHFSTKRMK